MTDPTPLSRDEVNASLTQAMGDAFDIVRNDPERRKALLTGLAGARDLSQFPAGTDQQITCVSFRAVHACSRDIHQIQALRTHVMSMWLNSLTSDQPTSLHSVVVRCFPDNIDDYLVVELEWITPILPVES